ncbi:MAG: phosphatase [Christensenellaceae bacterium]
MKFLVDTHTHTIASGHAYSTVRENAQEAFKIGMEGFVCADHGPTVQGGAPEFILSAIQFLPDYIEGVRVIKGTEANIVDYKGSIDISEKNLKYTEFAIASLHGIVLKAASKTQNTDAMIGALNNPYIDVIGHPGNPTYEIDRVALVKEAARLNKPIEINNHSFVFRTGSDVNCKDFIELCKKYGVRIVVSSDAHNCYSVGKFEVAAHAVQEANFPQELIASRNLAAFMEYLEERKKRLGD